jgi:hypothetical protein
MNDTPDVLAFVRSLHALKRMASPEEQARLVLFSRIGRLQLHHRHCPAVDGGVSINRT